MPDRNPSLVSALPKDLAASVVVFLVALPLCLGVALASNAPLFSGIIAGIIGGVLVGALSGSHKSVSGPAAGLTAVVATQIGKLGTFVLSKYPWRRIWALSWACSPGRIFRNRPIRPSTPPR